MLELDKMMTDLETSNSYMLGRNSSDCWIKPYMEYLKFRLRTSVFDTTQNVTFTYKYVKTFLKIKDNQAYKALLVRSVAIGFQII